ncbi:MAG: ABC-2 transporter permease [Erysipelotrichaceae bacterium]|nr:ABC-2 transporter permease [Erysipelotrichaceae bacterium]
MKGMIRKEICVILNNRKFLLVSLCIYLIYSVMLDNMSFFLPFMASMLSISSFSYDEYNNWQTYASSLPQGRLSIVRAKYVVAVGSVIIASLIGMILSYVVTALKGSGPAFDEQLSSLLGTVMAIMLMLSILFPILFRYGAEKGRLAMAVMGLGFAAVIMVLSRFIGPDISPSVIASMERYLPVIFSVICVLSMVISYFISKKIYLNKEF